MYVLMYYLISSAKFIQENLKIYMIWVWLLLISEILVNSEFPGYISWGDNPHNIVLKVKRNINVKQFQV